MYFADSRGTKKVQSLKSLRLHLVIASGLLDDLRAIFLIGTTLRVYSMIDGMNDFKPWLNEFRTCMINNQAKGYYDATNLQQAFESGIAFDIYKWRTQRSRRRPRRRGRRLEHTYLA